MPEQIRLLLKAQEAVYVCPGSVRVPGKVAELTVSSYEERSPQAWIGEIFGARSIAFYLGKTPFILVFVV
jgi:hypothetical protein